MKHLFKSLLIVLFGALCAMSTSAQGFRFGTIEYTIVSQTATDLTVRFDIEMEWDGNSIFFTYQNPAPAVGTLVPLPNLFFGDGNAQPINLEITEVEVICNKTIYKGISEIVHTYDLTNLAEQPPYAASTQYFGRAVELTDGNTAKPYRLLALVNPLGEGYDSPSISTPSPLATLVKPTVGTTSGNIDFNVLLDEGSSRAVFGFVDANESGLEAQTAQSDDGIPIFIENALPAPPYPADARIIAVDNLLPGPGNKQAAFTVPYELTPATPVGYYGIQVGVIDDRNVGPLVVPLHEANSAGGVVDYIIRIIEPCDLNITFDAPTPPSQTFDVNVGDLFTRTIRTTVSTTTPGLVYNADLSTTPLADGMTVTGTFISNPDGSTTYEEVFEWTPQPGQEGNYSITFTAKGINCIQDCGVTDTRSYQFNVCGQTFCSLSTTQSIVYNEIGGGTGIEYNPALTDNIVLTADAGDYAGDEIYEWRDASNNLLAETSNELTITGTPDATYTCLVRAENEPDCCTSEEEFTIDFFQNCNPSDDIVAIIDASNAGAGCGEEELTYYDGVSGPITLEAQITAGLTGPFTYLWSTGETTATIDVSPTMNTTYSVDITDANGCIANADVEVIYCDARAYKKNGDVDAKKVTICHYPPGNPGNVQTITISINALCTHITQHNGPGAQDQIGDCDCGSSNKTSNPIDYTEVTALSVYPNPSAGHFNIEYNLPEAGNVNIVMTDLTGRVVYTEAFDGAAGLYEHSLDLQGNAPGIYLLKVTLNADEYTVKVNITE